MKIQKILIIFSIMVILITCCGLASAASNLTDYSTSSSINEELEIAEPPHSNFYIEPSDFNINDMENQLNHGNFNKKENILKDSIIVSETTLADIQNAIDDAIDGDTIELKGTFVGEKDSNITINKTITIQSDGTAVLDGNGLTNIIYISSKNVVLKNLNFKNSVKNAIYWYGDNGNIQNCTFNNCSSKFGDGGAIYIYGNNSNIQNCTFMNCSASYGGAIFLEGNEIKVTNSLFEKNNATHGAISIMGMNCSVINCNFTNNSAYEGGAISTSYFEAGYGCLY